jgi:hypothetical protein
MTTALDIREKQRSRIREIQRKQTAAGAELDGTPLGALIAAGPVNVDRRASCERDLLRYLQTYFPASTGLSPFSDDHHRVIARIQDCILGGGLFCEAVYRGFAKTTISQNTALWAESYGHRKCIPLFGATDDDGCRNMQSIKLELETNDDLLDDFPEICAPIRALHGRPQRCASQTYKGEPTHIEWTADKIVLPTIPGSKASGAVLVSRGLTGASRGLVFKRSDGTNQRPDFALIDDPQTDESATSPAQVNKRLDIIRRSILKSAGHFKSLACVVTCTVRASNDVAEQLMDPKLSPSWQSERVRMVRRWADEHGDEATAIVPRKLGPLWRKYADIRNTFDRDNPNDQKRAWREATAFYREHQADMDRGCVISWEGCFDREHELSAIQHAYNMLIDDGADVFATECQNGTPLEILPEGMLTASQIASKVNGYARGTVPPEATHLTGFIDVQDNVLFWIVVAWRASDFTGFVVDYGCYPEQRRQYFTLKEAVATLGDVHRGGREAAWTAGLKTLTEALLGKAWPVHGGGALKISKCLVDAQYGDSTDTIYSFIRQSPFGGVLLPSHGRAIKATGSPMQFWPKQEGEKSGLNWRDRMSPKHRSRYVIYDTHFWKSFFHSRLSVPIGGEACLSLFAAEPREHQMLADHLTAEKPLLVEVHGGRRVNEWQEPPPDRDNHWFDGAVGCCVAGSMLGAALPTDKPDKKPNAKPRTKVNLAAPDGRSFFVTNR